MMNGFTCSQVSSGEGGRTMALRSLGQGPDTRRQCGDFSSSLPGCTVCFLFSSIVCSFLCFLGSPFSDGGAAAGSLLVGTPVDCGSLSSSSSAAAKLAHCCGGPK